MLLFLGTRIAALATFANVNKESFAVSIALMPFSHFTLMVPLGSTQRTTPYIS